MLLFVKNVALLILFSFLFFSDLELAAELGKALLEKNRELESQVNHLQNIIHDQTVEIQVVH